MLTVKQIIKGDNEVNMSNIRDVAKAAGVSTATVSRVINHDTKGRMTDETKEKVWEAIAQLNYKSPAKNIRKTSETKSNDNSNEIIRIGCVISTEKDKYSDPYYLSILSSIEEHARKNNYQIPMIATSKELEESKSLDSFFSLPLNGIILMNTLSASIYKYIKEQVPSIVGIDTAHTDIDNIVYDHYHAAALAVDTLVEKGYTNIGFFGACSEGSKLADSKRFRGYLSAMYSHGLNVNPSTCINCHWKEEECQKEIKRLYQNNLLPRALVVSSDLMAMAVLRALYDINIRVPDQIAVMGISNIEMSKYSNPPLSTISIPTYDLGILALDTLKQRIEGYDMLPRTISLPIKVVQRASV